MRRYCKKYIYIKSKIEGSENIQNKRNLLHHCFNDNMKIGNNLNAHQKGKILIQWGIINHEATL